MFLVALITFCCCFLSSKKLVSTRVSTKKDQSLQGDLRRRAFFFNKNDGALKALNCYNATIYLNCVRFIYFFPLLSFIRKNHGIDFILVPSAVRRLSLSVLGVLILSLGLLTLIELEIEGKILLLDSRGVL